MNHPATSLPADALHDVRARCHGPMPLSGRLEPWMHRLFADPDTLVDGLDHHGSPLNVLDMNALDRNADELVAVADARGVDLRIFFARKANKALAAVDAALAAGHGVDVASERELRQALERGATSTDLIVTAAVKPRSLLELCLHRDIVLAIDNHDELALLRALVGERGTDVRARVAVRLAPTFDDGRAPTRFGMSAADAVEAFTEPTPFDVVGVHFHLDGYAAADRTAALGQALRLVDGLRARGHEPRFIDMGGGIPMSYLDDGAQWTAFWDAHRAALLGGDEPLTFEGHGLGFAVHGGEVVGRPALYPYHQPLTRGPWLADVLTDEVVAGLRTRGLELRCEPGRSLLDGCGVTLARVEFRKQRADGTWLVGVAMNRTQCRSTSDDFLVDPVLVPAAPTRTVGTATEAPIDAYLVGAYCIERELLSWRRLRFPTGVEVGDIVAFPNTAGYLMHILESASHQIPLARNVVRADDGSFSLDPIDA